MEKGLKVPMALEVGIAAERPQGALGAVLERSRLLCLVRYEKELFTETSFLDLYAKCGTELNSEQLAVFAGECL